ncbi:hypothetical protein Calow_1958 [Caldicellulosiruptor owensensis OL]|uniref:O-antigen polymerase n=1 Tax=Caldicellulosiruptor owensensis (strain ATCC 700167 / DSM 13100 / OL) TaxID=632518 RepID=E4Q5S3_CALOW|nr:oligosaccharide repeat unit polymerase [Caldicellulosiruptor owensensis]ADQ05482.1 hypothetical protein Calow_1958 [Caldicellulosiruptor owensensis OL]
MWQDKFKENLIYIYVLFIFICFFGRYLVYPKQYPIYLSIALFMFIYMSNYILQRRYSKYTLNKVIKEMNIKWGEIIISFFLMVVILFNVVLNGLYKLTISSLFHALKGVIIIFFFVALKKVLESDCKVKQRFVKINFWLLNCYFIINIPILILQKNYTGFLMRKDFFKYNPLYLDHITGLIGASGTHVLAFYWISLIITNLLFYLKEKKKIVLLLLIGEVIFMIYISLYNDNKMFYIFLFIIAVMMYILTKEKILLTLIFVCPIIILVFYFINKNIIYNLFEYNNLLSHIKNYLYIYNLIQSGKLEKIERFFLVSYAIKDGGVFGKGIGSILLWDDPTLPKHFGINTMSIRIYEGGLIFYLSLILFHYSFYNKLINKNDLINSLMIIVLLLFSSFYTIIFEDLYIVFFFSLTCLLMTMWREMHIKFI